MHLDPSMLPPSSTIEKIKDIEDFKTLLSQAKQKDKELRLKRRWLMNLELTRTEAKRMKHLIPPKDKFLPESLIREDDLSYEHVRACIEKGPLASRFQKKKYDCQKEAADQDDEQENCMLHFNSKGLRHIFSMLDEMNNQGLCHFSEILSDGLTKFEKTNQRMKMFIKECLPEVLENQTDSCRQQTLLQLCQLLRDPTNFRKNYVSHLDPSKSFHAAAKSVLSKLEILSVQALSSMYRKVRGGKQPRKSGLRRRFLSEQVRKKCVKLLSELGEADELQEPLASALAIASLSLKLEVTSSPIFEFRKFSPETESLQSEIIKAIHSLDKNKVSFTELKDLLFLLDPNAKFTKRIRVSLRNLLIGYLFECADMETIPEFLLEALSVINKKANAPSYQSFSEEDLAKEMECVLSVSSQAKQIVWDLLSECGLALDQGFADAYMEDVLESDDGISSEDDHQGSDHCGFHSDKPIDQTESVGETIAVDHDLPICSSTEGGSSVYSPKRKLNTKTEVFGNTEMDSVGTPGHFLSNVTESKMSSSTVNTKAEQYIVRNMGEICLDPHKLAAEQTRGSLPSSHDGRSNGDELGAASGGSAKTFRFAFASSLGEETDDKGKMMRNEYLSLQEACDKTSVVAYHFVGCMLNKLAQAELLMSDDDISSHLHNFGDSKSGAASSKHDACGSTFFSVLEALSKEQLIPAFPTSRSEKLKELMGITKTAGADEDRGVEL